MKPRPGDGEYDRRQEDDLEREALLIRSLNAGQPMNGMTVVDTMRCAAALLTWYRGRLARLGDESDRMAVVRLFGPQQDGGAWSSER